MGKGGMVGERDGGKRDDGGMDVRTEGWRYERRMDRWKGRQMSSSGLANG